MQSVLVMAVALTKVTTQITPLPAQSPLCSHLPNSKEARLRGRASLSKYDILVFTSGIISQASHPD